MDPNLNQCENIYLRVKTYLSDKVAKALDKKVYCTEGEDYTVHQLSVNVSLTHYDTVQHKLQLAEKGLEKLANYLNLLDEKGVEFKGCMGMVRVDFAIVSMTTRFTYIAYIAFKKGTTGEDIYKALGMDLLINQYKN
jgi:hypothetical protein